ncbi:MAG: ABC transporter ATP-binding protein [Fusicatenibacter sp.]|nr:ABC transporter ATP-binding protein [Fusicatenibacter sp.]
MNELVTCENLTKCFGNRPALSDLNFSLERGKIIGLLGPNGSGKTTLLKLINGLLVPTKGEVRIDGNLPGVETRKIISYLPDKMFLGNWMHVRDLIEYYADFFSDFDRSRATAMLESLQISPDDRLKTMSKGTKEKVQLILTMSRRASLYCLDEPIAGVDPAARDYILSTILNNYDENATILISTHLIADVENILDEVLFLRDGQLKLQASVEDIRTHQGTSVDALFREVFKC